MVGVLSVSSAQPAWHRLCQYSIDTGYWPEYANMLTHRLRHLCREIQYMDAIMDKCFYHSSCAIPNTCTQNVAQQGKNALRDKEEERLVKAINGLHVCIKNPYLGTCPFFPLIAFYSAQYTRGKSLPYCQYLSARTTATDLAAVSFFSESKLIFLNTKMSNRIWLAVKKPK